MTLFLGTLWSSIKQAKAPYLFDGEHRNALHAMKGIGPVLAARGKSQGFSRVAAGNWGIFSSYGGDGPSKFVFVQPHQVSCLVMRDTSEISLRLGRAIGTLLEMRWETQGHFPVATGISGFLSTFKRSQASSPFEALNSASLSRSQRDVRPPLE